jgi:sugar lactone lactonase YvrE
MGGLRRRGVQPCGTIPGAMRFPLANCGAVPSKHFAGCLPGAVLLTGALLLGIGCGGRTPLLDGTGKEPPDAGAVATFDGATQARDLPLDDARDTALDSAGEAGSSDAGRLDGGNPAEAGGSLRLLAGGLGGNGNVDGVGTAARFRDPNGVASDGAGNLFIMDFGNNTIRRVVIATGEVTTLAGSPGQEGRNDGIGAAARFQYPHGIASDRTGHVFVADTNNHTIRKVATATGEVTTLAGSPGQAGSSDGRGTEARFDNPRGVASDAAGTLVVADHHTIRKVVIATGEVTTLAGSPGQGWHADGIGAAARFVNPDGVASDGVGNLFVVDGQTIRKVVVATGEVTTLAGSPGEVGTSDGTGTAARFSGESGIASDGAGNLFVADRYNQTIRKVVVATGEVTTLAGSAGKKGSTDGTGTAARFVDPADVASDGAGNLFVVDSGNSCIRKVVTATGEVTTLAGSGVQMGSLDGSGAAARFAHPNGMASDEAGNLFVVDSGNHTIRKVAIATGEVTTLAGSPGQQGSTDGIGASARFHDPSDVVGDGAGHLYVADTTSRAIRKVVIATGAVTTLTRSPGPGEGTDGIGLRLNGPVGIANDGAGNLFVTDFGYGMVWKVVIATGEVTAIAGSAELGSADGTGTAARFYYPMGIASDRAGNLFVADMYNSTIRKVVIATGEVSTIAGSPEQTGGRDGVGPAARFWLPTGIAMDKSGNLLVADSGNMTIRRIDMSTRAVTTVVGSPERMGVVLEPLPAALRRPWGLVLGAAGELFVSDSDENAILVARF